MKDEGHDDYSRRGMQTYSSRIPTSGNSRVGGVHRRSRSWSGGTSRWSVPWRTVPLRQPGGTARIFGKETFWTAWQQRASLDQPDRLKAWLCGIARNLAKNARRKASRPAESAGSPEILAELSTEMPGPAEEAVSREEETLLWQVIERIPAAYREPLILFYREDQSVAEVAGALALSEDAVKQRLSRGRAMLRERVAILVEGGLRRSRPGRRFTVSVMAGLAAHAAGAKTALAGAAASTSAWKAAAGAPVRGRCGSAVCWERSAACWAGGSAHGPRPRPPRRAASAMRSSAPGGAFCWSRSCSLPACSA